MTANRSIERTPSRWPSDVRKVNTAKVKSQHYPPLEVCFYDRSMSEMGRLLEFCRREQQTLYGFSTPSCVAIEALCNTLRIQPVDWVPSESVEVTALAP